MKWIEQTSYCLRIDFATKNERFKGIVVCFVPCELIEYAIIVLLC